MERLKIKKVRINKNSLQYVLCKENSKLRANIQSFNVSLSVNMKTLMYDISCFRFYIRNATMYKHISAVVYSFVTINS